MPRLRPSAAVRVQVPATSANVGPGFDSFGLALAKYDTVEIEVGQGPGPLSIDVQGEGAHEVPRDSSHLVVDALLTGLLDWCGERPEAVRLRCHNQLPHGRGLGSSAAAIVAGLLAARAVLEAPDQVTDDDVLTLAARLEGHPDNVAAAMGGGFTLAWMDGVVARRLSLSPDPRIQPVVCVPGWPMSTETARGLLPAQVTHADAVFTATRSALLVAALTSRPDLLLQATEDRLHQPYRAAALGRTSELVGALRAAGIPAVVSGSGPSVLALVHAGGGAARESAGVLVSRHAGADWVVEALGFDQTGARVEYLDADTRLGL